MAFSAKNLSSSVEDRHQDILMASFTEEIHQHVERMVEDAVQSITKSASFFKEPKLIDKVMKIADDAASNNTLPMEVLEHDMFRKLVEHYVSMRVLVPIGNTGNLTTPELVEREKVMLRLAGARNNDHILDEALVRSAIASKKNISEEQIRAVEAACLSDRPVTTIEGTAGAGKSFTMEAVKESYQKSGYDVMGTALSWNAAKVLGSSINLDGCMALDNLITTMNAARAAGTEFFRNPTLLIVDEAGMVGTVFMAKLLEEAARSKKKVKVVLTGDSRQVNPVDAGNALEAIVEYHGSTRINTIRRQKQESHRHAVMRLSHRQSGAALHTYLHQEALHWAPDRSTMLNMVVREFISYREAYPEKSALVLALVNDDVVEINKRIRQVYRKLGKVGAKEVKVDVTDGKRRWNAPFSVGDEVVLRSSGKQLTVYHIDPDAPLLDESKWVATRKGVYNRNFGKIVAMRKSPKPAGSTDFIVDLGGDEPGRVIINSHTYKHRSGGMPMVHNFATTIYGSQGQTVDKVFLLDSPLMEFRLAYVGMSRHRESVEVYFDETELHNRLDRDFQKSTPLGFKEKERSFGQEPEEIAVQTGRYSRSEMLQRAALGWAKESENLTAMVYEKRKRRLANAAKKDEELSAIEQADPDEPLLDFIPEINVRYPLIDIERVLELPDPVEETDVIKPSDVEENNIGQSLREMPTRKPLSPDLSRVDRPAPGLFKKAVDFFRTHHDVENGPHAPVAEEKKNVSAFEDQAPQRVGSSVKNIKKEIPFLPLPTPIGEVVDGNLLFTGVPQTQLSDADRKEIPADFLKSLNGKLWEPGRYGEPRIIARAPNGRVMDRYRLDGKSIIGNCFPPMLMNPRPDKDTPVVIVPGAREFFLLASHSRENNKENPAKVPHVIWAAKDADWKPIANALRQQPVVIMRSKHDEAQQVWAANLEKELSEEWGVKVIHRPPMPTPVVETEKKATRRLRP